MTEQQEHLSTITLQQTKIIEEIQILQQNLNQKREFAIKLQGVIEYLTELGVKLVESEKEQSLE